MIAGNKDLSVTSKRETVNLHVNSCVVSPVLFVKGYPQKKGVIPSYCYHCQRIKCVKDVFCVDHLSSENLVTNVQTVAPDLPVGTRLHQFWKKMDSPGGKPESGNSAEGGLCPPLPVQTQLDQVTHHQKLLSKSPQKSTENLAAAFGQNRRRTSKNSKLTGVSQQTISSAQTQQPVETYPGPQQLKPVSKNIVFQMETPDTIRTSLQTGEWVTSTDFKDAYFHILIQAQSRKYMCFHIQGKSYQFKALPFGLSTAPMEFTVVAKDVKVMALQRGIKIHQYLDDWLVRAKSDHICLQHTQTLVALC